jgi:predicted N-acyltransferase
MGLICAIATLTTMSREPEDDIDGADDYVTRVVADLSEIQPNEWDALVSATCGSVHPALRHAFLDGLHRTGCACPETGWEPEFLTLWRSGVLHAAAPLYRKFHSYGEYVFDWAWADALQRAGGTYYPKLLCAVPFTPVSAPKLLATDQAARKALAAALLLHAQRSGVSSLHVLFPEASELRELESLGLMERTSVQFHWSNAGYASFDDFLATLSSAKRRKIRAERRKVQDAGISLCCLRGSEASAEEWDFAYRCYSQTYLEHGNAPYLTREFFQHLALNMGEQVLLVLASQGTQRIAATLSLFNEHALYGRYWGAIKSVDCLHFEACYYTPLEFCIEQGIRTFEGGAQGEHKLARGFMPSPMPSVHWIAHEGLERAVARYLLREADGMHQYLDELTERTPYSLSYADSSFRLGEDLDTT